MLKKIIEAPFQVIAWLFKDTYGRVVSVLLLTLLVCLVNYPVQDTEVGVWEVEDTLKQKFSYDEKEGTKLQRPSDVDETKRLDRAAIESR